MHNTNSATAAIQIRNYLEQQSKIEKQEEIIKSLLCKPPCLPCKYFYNEKGSRLFESITQLEEYYPTRTEKHILQQKGAQIAPYIKGRNIVELGSGDPSKISLLLESLFENNIHELTYYPFDVSKTALEDASNKLNAKFPGLKIQGIVADFMTQISVIPRHSPLLYCFLGSTIGNLEPKEAENLIESIYSHMQTGDQLLLGLDLVKDIKLLEKAYNDRTGITEAFNKNILDVTNKLIGSSVDKKDFDHLAFFNEKFQRIEMHLKARKQVAIQTPLLKHDIILKAGSSIHTENSHKYTSAQIQQLLSRQGFSILEQFSDPNQWFTLVLAEKPA